MPKKLEKTDKNIAKTSEMQKTWRKPSKISKICQKCQKMLKK